LWFSRHILPVLTFGITIPLWLILTAGLWLHLDKASTVRRAVDRAVSDLVHSAELDAAAAREEALRKIMAERERLAERDRAALARFAEMMADAEIERRNLLDEIAELEALPAPDSCVVDGDLAERLRLGR
ncbi:MAG: hypothetical protein AB7E55_34125, partial [Pigmentiphaga sp.]